MANLPKDMLDDLPSREAGTFERLSTEIKGLRDLLLDAANYIATASEDEEYRREAKDFVQKIDRVLRDPMREHLAVKVWNFKQAPEEFQQLSHRDGREVWVALVPEALRQDWADWAYTRFGKCSIERHERKDGSVVLIGADA